MIYGSFLPLPLRSFTDVARSHIYVTLHFVADCCYVDLITFVATRCLRCVPVFTVTILHLHLLRLISSPRCPFTFTLLRLRCVTLPVDYVTLLRSGLRCCRFTFYVAVTLRYLIHILPFTRSGYHHHTTFWLHVVAVAFAHYVPRLFTLRLRSLRCWLRFYVLHCGLPVGCVRYLHTFCRIFPPVVGYVTFTLRSLPAVCYVAVRCLCHLLPRSLRSRCLLHRLVAFTFCLLLPPRWLRWLRCWLLHC